MRSLLRALTVAIQSSGTASMPVRCLSVIKGKGVQDLAAGSLDGTRLEGREKQLNLSNWAYFQAELNRKLLKDKFSAKELMDLIIALAHGAPESVEDFRYTEFEGQKVTELKTCELQAALCRKILKRDKNNIQALWYLADALERGASARVSDFRDTDFEGQEPEDLGYTAKRMELPAQLRALSERAALARTPPAAAILISDVLPQDRLLRSLCYSYSTMCSGDIPKKVAPYQEDEAIRNIMFSTRDRAPSALQTRKHSR